MFPIRPVPENDVKKPPMFVFRDMEDYLARGAGVDTGYQKLLSDKKKPTSKPVSAPVAAPSRPPKPEVMVPPELVGRKVKHKSYGEGTVTGTAGIVLTVMFSSVGEKKLGYEVCLKNRLIEFL